MIRNRLLLLAASFGLLVPAPARAREIAPGDLLMPCAVWGVTRIEPDTGEQKPLGINGNGAPLEIDDDGLVWAIDNRRVFSIDRATGDHRFVLEIPQNFTNPTIGDLLAEPGGTLLWAGYGEIWRIDPQARSLTSILSGAPLQRPLGLAWAPNGDLLILDQLAAHALPLERDGRRLDRRERRPDRTPGRPPTKVTVLPDGDYVVLRNGSPLRIDPDTGAQSEYSANVTQAIALEVAANGDLVYVTSTSTSNGQIRRISGPAATPQTLLAVGPLHPVQNARFLALTDDGHAVFGGTHREITEGVVTDSQGAIFELDLGSLDFRVLSQAAHNGGLVSTPDGRLFVAGPGGGASVREINPRTGEMFLVVQDDPLVDAPLDAVLEPGGTLAVLNDAFVAHARRSGHRRDIPDHERHALHRPGEARDRRRRNALRRRLDPGLPDRGESRDWRRERGAGYHRRVPIRQRSRRRGVGRPDRRAGGGRIHGPGGSAERSQDGRRPVDRQPRCGAAGRLRGHLGLHARPRRHALHDADARQRRAELALSRAVRRVGPAARLDAAAVSLLLPSSKWFARWRRCRSPAPCSRASRRWPGWRGAGGRAARFPSRHPEV